MRLMPDCQKCDRYGTSVVFDYLGFHIVATCLSTFLEQFAQEHSQEINIIQLDNARLL